MSAIKSMTGFGCHAAEGPGDTPEFAQSWEVKSVNSRHLDVKWRLPPFLRSQESAWERTLREFGARGRVEICLHLTVREPSLLRVSLNTALARAMLGQLQLLAAAEGQTFTPDYSRLLGLSYLWDDDSTAPAPELLQELESGFRAALAAWVLAREAEGAVMAQDIRDRIETMGKHADDIAELVPQAQEEKIKALEERIAALLENRQLAPDPDRMLQEIALMADRLDVSEELTRLRCHLDQLRKLLDAGGECGKRIDFTLQECFREINTCGSKCQDPRIARLVVECKAELEKCREQTQNLE